MRQFSRAMDVIYKLVAFASGALLILLCALVLYSILARAFGLYAGGATDFAGYVMATSTFLALARCAACWMRIWLTYCVGVIPNR